MKYHSRNVYVNTYDFNHVYNMEFLISCSASAVRSIENLEREIQHIKEYQQKLYNHVQMVVQLEFRKEVSLARRTVSCGYGKPDKIGYTVSLDHVPEIDEIKHKVSYERTDVKTFEGKDRHLAFKYAESLAKQHHCKVVKEGYWKQK